MGFYPLGDGLDFLILLLFDKCSHDDDEYDAVEDVYNGKGNQHTNIERNIIRSTADGRINSELMVYGSCGYYLHYDGEVFKKYCMEPL